MTDHVALSRAVTRDSVRGVSWWNHANQPLQDNQTVRVETCSDDILQTWEGLGGAVSELGAQALNRLPGRLRRKFFAAVFGPRGANLSWIRLPVGASDFTLGAYSFSEAADDYDMARFSIERDRQCLIPYIRAAMDANPNLRVHASPWSPPGWMKKSGRMDGVADCELRDEPRVLKAYARYLRLFIQAYAGEGVRIDRLMVQNEMDSPAPFPSCRWTPELFVRFHLKHLKPEFEAHRIRTEVWAGTFRTISGLQAHACFRDAQFRAFVKGAAFQYSFPRPIADLRILHPGTRIMHTETVCHGGANTEVEAAGQFDDFLGYAEAGASVFTYWNTVLGENPASSWGWKQNSMCTANGAKQDLMFNPDYSVFRLLGANVKPGAVRVRSFSQLLSTACFRNPDGRFCLLLRNLEGPRTAEVTLDGAQREVRLRGHALCALALGGN
jgi:glucosylceramidase